MVSCIGIAQQRKIDWQEETPPVDCPFADLKEISRSLGSSGYELAVYYLPDPPSGDAQAQNESLALHKLETRPAKDEVFHHFGLKITVQLKDKSKVYFYVTDISGDSFIDSISVGQELAASSAFPKGKEVKLGTMTRDEDKEKWTVSLNKVDCKSGKAVDGYAPAAKEDLFRTLIWVLTSKGYYQPALHSPSGN